MRHLILNLEAPLMAFGGETIDNYGVIRPFPSASMLTGLLANALGWRRVEAERHQQLQDRLVFAARIDRTPYGGLRMRDYQTALLFQDDRGWTTRGQPEGRETSPTYRAAPGETRKSLTQQRYRDYWADMRVTVALRLNPEADDPTLDRLAAALQEPARPLFIGRKPCLPSGRLFNGFAEGRTVLEALRNASLKEESKDADTLRVMWPDGEGIEGVDANHRYMLTDQRNWVSGLHGGGRWVCEGVIKEEQYTAAGESQAPDKEQQ